MHKRLLPFLLLLALLLTGCNANRRIFTIHQDGMTITVNTKFSVVSDGTNTYTYLLRAIGSEDSRTQYVSIHYPEDAQYTLEHRSDHGKVHSNGTGNEAYVSAGYTTGEALSKAILQAHDQLPDDSVNPKQILLGCVFLAAALMNLLLPEAMWWWNHGRWTDGGKASDDYLIRKKMSAAIAGIIGVIFLLCGIF